MLEHPNYYVSKEGECRFVVTKKVQVSAYIALMNDILLIFKTKGKGTVRGVNVEMVLEVIHELEIAHIVHCAGKKEKEELIEREREKVCKLLFLTIVICTILNATIIWTSVDYLIMFRKLISKEKMEIGIGSTSTRAPLAMHSRWSTILRVQIEERIKSFLKLPLKEINGSINWMKP